MTGPTPAPLPDIHPGEVLREAFMKPLGITARRLAADIDVPPSRISELVNGKRPVTADTAVRLGAFFGMEARFWLHLQIDFELRQASLALKDVLLTRIRKLGTPTGTPPAPQ